jgi:putative Holliday junction resolvase
MQVAKSISYAPFSGKRDFFAARERVRMGQEPSQKKHVSPYPVSTHRQRRIDAALVICSNCVMQCGRILALDYGHKNVGLACCDEMGVTVRPLPSVPNRGRRDLVGRLRCAVLEHRIERIVVGIPFNMDGSSGEAVRRIEHVMEYLRTELSLPMDGMDERLSTTEAAEIWREMSLRQQGRYRTVDSLAAAMILQRYLEES